MPEHFFKSQKERAEVKEAAKAGDKDAQAIFDYINYFDPASLAIAKQKLDEWKRKREI